MAAVCPTPTSSRKRCYYEADERSAYDVGPLDASPACSQNKRARVGADVAAAAYRLRCLFPMVDDATVRRVLDACAHDVDAAVAQLSALQLAREAKAPPPPPPPPPVATPTPPESGDVASYETAEEWIGAFVDEMAKSADVADARERASRALRAFEAFVLARCPPPQPDGDRVAKMERENAVLKRAVTIQNARLKAQESEIGRLAKKTEDQAEKLKQAETTNYSLSCHLRHSSPGGAGTFGFRPPDIY